MGMGGGGGGGNPSSSSTAQQHWPNWVGPIAKDYLYSLASYIFPGITAPQGVLESNGVHVPLGGSYTGHAPGTMPTTGGGGAMGGTPGMGQAGQQQGGSATAGGLPGINPGLYDMFGAPMIASSPYLQTQAANNPAGAAGTLSPAAFNQLANLYL